MNVPTPKEVCCVHLNIDVSNVNNTAVVLPHTNGHCYHTVASLCPLRMTVVLYIELGDSYTSAWTKCTGNFIYTSR